MPLLQLWHQTVVRSGAILAPATLPHTPHRLDGTES